MTFAVIFPIVIGVGGVLFVGLGGWKAWHASDTQESGKFLKVAGMGGVMLIVGIVGIFLVNKWMGDEEVEVVIEEEVGSGTGSVGVKTEIVLEGEGAGSGEVVTETGSEILEEVEVEEEEVVEEEPEVVTTREELEEIINKSGEHTREEGEMDVPHTGEIRLLGISFNKGGEPAKDLFVNEEFQINLGAKNADFFVWDLDRNVDTDNDGIPDNDYDVLGEDPAVTFKNSGKFEMILTAANADNLIREMFSVVINEKAPEVDFMIRPDAQYPALVHLDASETEVFSAGEVEFVWRVDGQEIRLEEEGDGRKGEAGWFILPTTGVFEIECEVVVASEVQTGRGERNYVVSKSEKHILNSILSAEIISEEKIKIAPAEFAFSAHAGDYSSTGLDERVVRNYFWDFGDGSDFVKGSVEKNVGHIFYKPGIFEVKLSVTDEDDITVTDIFQVFVSDDGAPVAFFEMEPEKGHRGDVFTFDAGVALMANGKNQGMDFSWDFGDESQLQKGRRVTHKFEELGSYRVTLSATDGSGGQFDGFYDSHSERLEIVPAVPIANFWADEIADLVMEFDASATLDPDDNIVKYQWDFGDGGNAVTEEPKVRNVFERAGEFTIYLVVRDADGNVSEVTKKVEVGR